MCDLIDTTAEVSVQATALDIEDETKGLWRLEAYVLPGADPVLLGESLAALAANMGLTNVLPEVIAVEDLDWVAKSQSDLSPITAGRFFVHGSHDRHRRPVAGTSVEIDAAQAFGTGHHATTLGCLIAFDRVLKRTRPRSVLDLGCGSGILAIAAALSCRVPVTAADIDPVAVRIAASNAAANGAAAYVRTFAAAGTGHIQISAGAPYEVVFANILARPLEMLAPEIASVLASGGRAILSGLTPAQEARVSSAYLLQRLPIEQRIRINGWSTLVLSSGGSRKSADRDRLRSGCRRARDQCR